MRAGIEIGVATQQELRPALTLVLRTLPADQRAPLVDSLASLRAEPLAAFQALLVARQHRKLVAACWGQPQPGKSCSLWTPKAETGEPGAELATAMIDRTVQIADSAGVAVCQTLAETPNGSMHIPLERAGFRRVASLNYLQWKPSRMPAPKAHAGVTFEPYSPADPERLERIILQTYQSTFDFPELDGMRGLPDVIYGYQCVGEFRAELWSYLVIEGEDAGVLMLSEHPQSKQLELVYMGVAPAARGRGLGGIAVAHAQHTAAELGVERFVLAVDSRNQVADQIYRSAGFRRWASRFVYLRASHG